MTKLYKAVSRLSGGVSAFLVHHGMVCSFSWRGDETVDIAKSVADKLSYCDMSYMEKYASEPVLVAEW